MNEFIVWYSNDINKDKFSKEFTLQELISQDHYDYISDSPLLVNYKVDSINRGIGLKDTNGKSIYADSSIVEFIAKRLGKPNIKTIGIFKYSDVSLRYNIELITAIGDYDLFAYDDINMSQFEIIDTMQENKLGLIKA